MVMIAEIYHKISQSGSNLNDRLEDNLTGNFFGTMRYLSFNRGLKRILVDFIYPKELASQIERIDIEYWNDNISFWPYDVEGEIDIMLDFPDTIIGIEVKYLSGLSSDDRISNEVQETEKIYQESKHQLARESRIVSKRGNGKKKLLIFIANEADSMSIFYDTIKRGIIADGVSLGILSWQNILAALNGIKFANEFERLMLSDLKKLLFTKGFERFKNFLACEECIIDELEFYNFEGRMTSFQLDYEIKGDLFYEFG